MRFDGHDHRSAMRIDAFDYARSPLAGTASWTPLDLDNLVCYYEADQLTGLADNDPISSITDLSGNNFHLTATTTVRPTYQTNTLNGLPVIQFDGVDDVSTNAGDGRTLTVYTVAAVYNNIVEVGAQVHTPIFSISGVGESYRRETANSFIFGLGGFGFTVSAFAMPQARGAILVQVNCPGNNIKVWVNGVKVFDGTLSATLPASVTFFGLKMGQDSSVQFGEYGLAAAFATEDELTVSEIDSFFTTYNAKYALY